MGSKCFLRLVLIDRWTSRPLCPQMPYSLDSCPIAQCRELGDRFIETLLCRLRHGRVRPLIEHVDGVTHVPMTTMNSPTIFEPGRRQCVWQCSMSARGTCQWRRKAQCSRGLFEWRVLSSYQRRSRTSTIIKDGTSHLVPVLAYPRGFLKKQRRFREQPSAHYACGSI